MNRVYLTLSFSLLLCSAFAQQKKVLADRIIATVGDKIILKSEIDINIADMQRQGQVVPENASCLVLEQAMGIKTLMLHAEKDSFPLT